MFQKNLCSTLFLIAIATIAICGISVQSLKVEKIVGGWEAEPESYKYEIALVLRTANLINKVFCSAGLVTPQHAVTAGQCTVQILQFWSDAFARIRNPKSSGMLFIEIEIIYIPEEYNYVTGEGDLAVLKLLKPVEIDDADLLVLPTGSTFDAGIVAIFTGFGLRQHNIDPDFYTGLQLRYIRKLVLSDNHCLRVTQSSVDDKLCASSMNNNNGEPWGVCMGDGGGSLVDDTNTLIGVLSKARVDCIDILIPALYTRIKPFELFIRSAIEGEPLENSRTYRNPMFSK